MKDFSHSVKREPIQFKIDDDVFYAAPEIGAEILRPMMLNQISGIDPKILKAVGDGNVDNISHEDMIGLIKATQTQTEQAMQFLDLVLLPESSTRFAERMKSTVNPITLDQAGDVYQWLLAEYGKRPTKPSTSSSVQSQASAGTSLTDGALVETSRPLNSILSDSSI